MYTSLSCAGRRPRAAADVGVRPPPSPPLRLPGRRRRAPSRAPGFVSRWKFFHLLRLGGGEETRAALLGETRDDGVEGLDETHGEKPISLVEDQELASLDVHEPGALHDVVESTGVPTSATAPASAKARASAEASVPPTRSMGGATPGRVARNGTATS